MDPTKNITYKLIGDLIREVQERFPDKYFHVGGDEVELDCWWVSTDGWQIYDMLGDGSVYLDISSAINPKVRPIL